MLQRSLRVSFLMIIARHRAQVLILKAEVNLFRIVRPAHETVRALISFPFSDRLARPAEVHRERLVRC